MMKTGRFSQLLFCMIAACGCIFGYALFGRGVMGGAIVASAIQVGGLAGITTLTMGPGDDSNGKASNGKEPVIAPPA